MLKAGITGGIGSGKTTVCKIFETLGIPVYYADEQAKKLMQEDQELIKSIRKKFGEEAYEGRMLNRQYLAERVFQDKEQLQQLNELVHPAVGRDFEKWLANYSEAPYILKEAALLFESGSYKALDSIIMVYAPEGLRVERVMSRDNISAEKVKARMANQWSDELKKEKSDHVIINDEAQLLIPQVLKIHNIFKNQ